MSFTPSPRFAEELARETQMRSFLDEVTREAVRDVEALAPVGDSGDLKDSIDGDVKLTGDGYVGEVTVGIWYWHFSEYGTSRTRAQPYLRPGVLKTLSRRGGRLGEGR